MKEILKSNSGIGPGFQEIVECVPGEIVAFFHSLEPSHGRMALSQKADVLNAVARDEYMACAACRKGDGESATVLMKWYEVFRDIFILKRTARSGEAGVLKNPNNFTTFARTFEPLAFLPDFWFAADRNVVSPNVRGRAHGIRLAFERFLYERNGGGVWGAMDWEMNRFLHRRIYEALKSDEKGALRRIAALALTARAVAAGEMGIYIEERDDVSLPLSGFSNVHNDPNRKNPLLKYYHYDRFTQLSFAREHEFALDPNVSGPHVRFERQWVVMAVLSDVILKESDAHSTHAAATRVMMESLAQCMLKIKNKLLRDTSHKSIRAAVDMLYTLATGAADDFADISEADLLKALGLRDQVASSRYYLDRCGFSDASDFWRNVLPVFREFQDAYYAKQYSVVTKYTEEQMRGSFKDRRSVVQFVGDALEKGNVSELPGEVERAGVQHAFLQLMLGGAVTLQYTILDKVLAGDEKSMPRRMRYWSDVRCRARELPQGMPFAMAEFPQFHAWVVQYLSKLSEQSIAEKNEGRQAASEECENGNKNAEADDASKRNKSPVRKSLSYKNVNFCDVFASAEKLWNFYFTEDEICRSRWIVSINRVLEILKLASDNNYGSYTLDKTYSWACTPALRSGLQARLRAERADISDRGFWPEDIEKFKAELNMRPSCTINDMLSGESRILVMIAVLARLMVHSALIYPALWSRREELFSFYTHILIASNHDFDNPFPCHLDVYSGSYLRIGRSHSRQTNVVDDLVDGRFYDESERILFAIFVAHYLAGRDDALDVINAISADPHMRKYFADQDLDLAGRRLTFMRMDFE